MLANLATPWRLVAITTSQEETEGDWTGGRGRGGILYLHVVVGAVPELPQEILFELGAYFGAGQPHRYQYLVLYPLVDGLNGPRPAVQHWLDIYVPPNM